MLPLMATEAGPPTEGFEIASEVALWIEYIAVVVITVAVAIAIVRALLAGFRLGWEPAFEAFKRYMARGLLVGLDLLIAADIIKTVTFEPTLENASVLGILVLIRTFLSWSLVVEAEGHWPWQQAA